MKMQGFTKNYKVQEQKKDFEWANEEAEEIKFDDDAKDD